MLLRKRLCNMYHGSVLDINITRHTPVRVVTVSQPVWSVLPYSIALQPAAVQYHRISTHSILVSNNNIQISGVKAFPVARVNCFAEVYQKNYTAREIVQLCCDLVLVFRVGRTFVYKLLPVHLNNPRAATSYNPSILLDEQNGIGSIRLALSC